jgi:hypothetical protein
MCHTLETLGPATTGVVRAATVVRLLALTTLLGALLPGCAPDDAEMPRASPPMVAPENPTVVPHPAGAQRPGLRFDPDTLAPGSAVGELALDSVWRRGPAAGRDADSAFFAGEITLSGSTVPHPDPDAAEVAVCFEPDPSSAARMPRWVGDERRIWFCFENVGNAAHSLAAPGEEVGATVVIDEYRIHYGPSDEVNTARLLEVVERTPAPGADRRPG